jgi:uncharacterized membrane protein YhiD involved in acid resistance
MALGIACGLGNYPLAIAGLVLALLILGVGGPVERLFERLAARREPASQDVSLEERRQA